jgi:hypothetical protein
LTKEYASRISTSGWWRHAQALFNLTAFHEVFSRRFFGALDEALASAGEVTGKFEYHQQSAVSFGSQLAFNFPPSVSVKRLKVDLAIIILWHNVRWNPLREFAQLSAPKRPQMTTVYFASSFRVSRQRYLMEKR